MNILRAKYETSVTRKVMANLKQVNLTVDRNGFAESEIGKGSIIKHYSNRSTR